MKNIGTVSSIQVGLPHTYATTDSKTPPSSVADSNIGAPNDPLWRTAFFKHPVIGPVQFHHDHIEGDGSADRVHHGGIDKAVLAYSLNHYAPWQIEWNVGVLPYGAFGENLSIMGLTEDDVCLGDIWRLGNVLMQVSQPRQPCWKLGRRWNRTDLPKRVIETGRTGWYLRVVTQGSAAAGKLSLEERPYAEWTVSRCNHIAYAKNETGAISTQRHALAEIPVLSLSWREKLAK